MKSKMTYILALAVMVVFAAGTAWPAILNVDNTIPCNDSTGTPYCTIQAAIDKASDGDTINVAAGTYDEYLVIQKSLHLIGEDKNTTILTYTASSPTVEQLIMLGWNTGGTLAGGATIQGFKLVGDVGLDGDRDLIKLRANGASGAAIVIKDNIFKGDGVTRYLGIETAYDAGYVKVENNEFYDLAYGAWFNVLINAEIKGNSITDAIFTALALCTSELDQIHDVDIVDNMILRSSTYPSPPPSWGPWLSGMHIGSTVYNITISGNTISDGNYHAIVIHDRDRTVLTDVHINCNNIHDNASGSINEVATTVTVDAENNWWGDASGPTNPNNPSGTGDAVGDGIDFAPWLDDVVSDPCPPPPGPEDVLDHFTCYDVKELPPKFKKLMVYVKDQFMEEEKSIEVKKPRLICIPCTKDGVPFKNPANFILKLYEVKKAPPKLKDKNLLVTDQFGEEDVEVKKMKYLAVPATKLELP